MTNGNSILESDEVLEQLLRKAPRRPMPSDEDTAAVHDAVKSEWFTIAGRRRTRRRLLAFAAAATVLLTVGVTVSLLRVPSAIPVPVATLQKSVGSLHFLGEQSQLETMPDLARLMAGQTIVTGHGSGASIAWGTGGELRMDEDTRITLTSPQTIRLLSGRVYFDSEPSLLQAGITQSSAADFAVQTEHGTVRHVGTQFMTELADRSLTVSVREGRVAVEGSYHDAAARAGEQLMLAGSNRPAITRISRHGEIWDWVEKMTPAVDFEGRSAYEFIAWVARESGLDVHFSDSEAEQHAHKATMRIGTVTQKPRRALGLFLQTAGLEANIEDGRIVISRR